MSEHPSPQIVFVVAVAENGVIGRDNEMPWRLKSDLKRFRAITWGKPIVMGRRTFLSIGRPLPGRTNIVVSRDPGFAAPGAVVAPSLETALALARADASRRSADSIAIIGGADLFAQTFPLAVRLEVTLVHDRPEGDTHLPPIDAAVWREVERRDQPPGPGDSAAVTFVTYIRRTDAPPAA